jgi:2-oxoglutarate dehydrogenase E1 component
VTLEHYKFTEADLDREFVVPPSPLFGDSPSHLKLREIVKRLEDVYCNHIGAEFSHIQDAEQVNWWRSTLEQPFTGFDQSTRMAIMQGLIQGTGFEKFLQKKFKSEKRFGIDGCEVLIPGSMTHCKNIYFIVSIRFADIPILMFSGLQRMIHRLASLGAEQVVVGMPHRGRLNVLSTVMQKPMAAILKEFQSLLEPGEEVCACVLVGLLPPNDL